MGLVIASDLILSVLSVCVGAPDEPYGRTCVCMCVCVCLQLSGMISDLPKVLILGAIAAASAFVVTILIVLVCVGCQR